MLLNKSCLSLLIASSLFFLGTASNAHALRYDVCKTPKQSLPCAVAFEKLRTLDNPLTTEKYFENNIHIKGNKLIKMPRYHIAQPDLDKDGVTEIIVALSEDSKDTEGLFCKEKRLCAHYIIQNRNPNPAKPRLRNYHVIGNTYAYGVGLSTDERLHNYQSLRIYKSGNPALFHVYQYDQKTDKYFNLGQQSKEIQ